MNSKVILLIGAGVLAYVWWQSQNALPSDAVAVTPAALASGASVTAGTQTLTGPGYIFYSPSTKLYYVSATAPTAAQLSAGAALFSATPTSSTGTGTGTGTTATGTQTTTTPPTNAAPTGASNGEPATYTTPAGGQSATPTTLAGLWAAIQQWAAADGNLNGAGSGVLQGLPDHWNFYVGYIWPSAPSGYSGTSWPPDLNAVFPGYDASTSMTGTQFWTGMHAYLQAGGLSGLRGLSGLGSVDNTFRVRGSGGWAA